MRVLTKGDVIINEIEVGDIHYEFEMGNCIKSKVLTKPTRNIEGFWKWESENMTTGKTIKYGQNEKYAHYGINLYNSNVYGATKFL